MNYLADLPLDVKKDGTVELKFILNNTENKKR
jgi:hypothetical protein